MTTMHELMMNVNELMISAFRNVHHRIKYVRHQNLAINISISLFE